MNEGALRTHLDALVSEKRVLVTVGAGGVGKTSTAAAIALLAAARGRRTLCLTIDPARRLAQALGLGAMSTEEKAIPAAHLRESGFAVEGSLTAMMLDTKRTFDELIRENAPSKERAERILSNRLYQYISTSLAGTQEYMAMEKLAKAKADARYDLIVLDTPPTPNALDFLDAPVRLVDALDGAAIRWFASAFEGASRASLGILSRSGALVLRAFAKITGAGLLESIAGLLHELNDLLGGFRSRAVEVERALRGDDVSFLIVTSPEPMSIREAQFFSERLRTARMPQGLFLVNRAHALPRWPIADEEAVLALLRSKKAPLDGPLAGRVRSAALELSALAVWERDRIAPLVSTPEIPTLVVPELAGDVHDMASLGALARAISSA